MALRINPLTGLFDYISEEGPQGEPGPGVPDGGETGQILKKKTGEDQDTEWTDAVDGGTF